MRVPACPTHHLRAALLVAAVSIPNASATATPLDAQSPERLRSVRHLALGNLSFLNTGKPAIHGGYLFQLSFRRNGIETDEFGASVVLPPHAYLHAMIAAGWAKDVGDESESGFSGVGQLGALWTPDDEWVLGINRFGPVGQITWGPTGYGAAMRAELFHGNVGLSLGYLWFEGPREDGVSVTIDLLRCILRDLGLVQQCAIP